MTAGQLPNSSGNYGSQLISAAQIAAPGFKVPDLQLKLGSVGVHSITCINSSACDIFFFPGSQTMNGTAIRVPKYTSMTFPVGNVIYTAVSVTGLPGAPSEYIALQWTDQDLVSLSTPTGTAPSPAVSNPWQAALDVTYTASGAQVVQLFNKQITFNVGFFLTDFLTWGLDAQLIAWAFAARFGSHISGPGPLLDGYGDAKVSAVTPVMLSQGLNSGYDGSSGSSIINLTLNPNAYAQGTKTQLRLYAAGYYV